MKTKQMCNDLYKDLCAEIGQLQLQLDTLNHRKAEILAQMHLLNAVSPELQKLESSLTTNTLSTILGC